MTACQQPAPTATALNVALAVFPDEARRYEDFACPFESRSGIRLKLVAQTYVDILRALEAEAGAGRGALDLVELDLATLGQARPEVAQIEELVTPPARGLFPSAAWQAATSGGHIFFIPHRLMWQAMIYNRVEVPKPPAAWGEPPAVLEKPPRQLGPKRALYEGAVRRCMRV